MLRHRNQLNFNSIKVRLKPRVFGKEGLLQFDFNSIKVRLKPCTSFKNPSISIFQFHKGTIKTNV